MFLTASAQNAHRSSLYRPPRGLRACRFAPRLAHSARVARGRAASGAKAKIGKCARFVAEQAVQLHGAMGVTEELDIGAYFKRLLAFDTLFGGSAHHYRRHAALSGRAHA